MTTLSLCSFSQSDEQDVLNDVREPDCNLAIWKRENIHGVDALLEDAPRDVRFTVRLSELSKRLPMELDASGFGKSAARKEVEADIRHLAKRYCDLLSLKDLEVRLESITTNSCRKWHSDYVKARLILTYVGQGTQWLDAVEADRVKRGAEPAHINTMNAGDVGIFKGKLAIDRPAIHRSPPIAETGETRLLLVLNPPVDG